LRAFAFASACFARVKVARALRAVADNSTETAGLSVMMVVLVATSVVATGAVVLVIGLTPFILVCLVFILFRNL
jgi:hypothetical protein